MKTFQKYGVLHDQLGPSTRIGDNKPTMDKINVISGGENMVGDSNATQKTYAHLMLHMDSLEKVLEDEDPIIFTPRDQGDVLLPHDDPLVISAIIAKHLVERIFVDNGSSMNLLCWNCFEKMHIAHNQHKTVTLSLYNFTGEAVPIVGLV